jgi:hypothetical protein
MSMQQRKVICVPSLELGAVAKWAYKESDRPTIHMVLFRNDEYVATDGHRMVRVPCKTHGFAFGVDRTHLLACVAAQRAIPGTVITLEPNGDTHVRIEISPGLNLLAPRRDPDTYPPIEGAMPKIQTVSSPDGYCLNPNFLADIAEVDAANSPGNPGIQVLSWSPTDADGMKIGAMLLRNRNGVRFLIMPMRGLG